MTTRWPEQMRRRTALEYLDMSASSFAAAIEAGELPDGTKKTGGIFWRRADLDRAIYGDPDAPAALPINDFARAI